MAKATKNGATAEASKSNTRPAVYFHDPDGERQMKLSAKTFYQMDTSPKAMFDYLAHFMVDKPNGKYLKKDAAIEILLQYNMGEIKELFELLRKATGDATFPND